MDVAIRDAMVPAADGKEFFARVRELGLSSVEIEVDATLATPRLRSREGLPYSVAATSGARALRRRLDGEGVRPAALLVANDFSGSEADAHVLWASRTVEAAAELGAPVVRIDPLARDKQLAAARVRESFIEGARAVLARTAGAGVDLGVENHGPLANDPAFLDAVFDAVDDPRLGMTLDTGNFYWYGYPLDELYRLLEKYAPRAKHTHLKNINYPPDLADRRREVGLDYGKYCSPLDEGNIDLRRVVRTLRGAEYRRDLCIENEALGKLGLEERMSVLRRDVGAVRGALD